MGILKKRASRYDDQIKLHQDNVILIAPKWCWVVKQENNYRRKQDFTRWRDSKRRELGQHLRDAHWILSINESAATTQGRFLDLAFFWHFLEEMDPTQQITILKQIDSTLYQRYHHWLSQQLAQSGPYQGRPLHPNSIYSRLQVLKQLLQNRIEFAPAYVSQELLTANLPLPPWVRDNPRQCYSTSESKRILRAMQQVLHLSEQGTWDGIDGDIPLAILVLLAYRTGGNLTPLLGLTVDSLHPHPSDANRIILILQKQKTNNKEIRQVHGGSVKPPHDNDDNHPDLQSSYTLPAHYTASRRVVTLIQQLQQRNAQLRAQAPLRKEKSLWLYATSHPKGPVNVLTMDYVNQRLKILSERFALRDDRNQPLRIRISRIRPTFIQTIYEMSGYDGQVAQNLAGHSQMKTTLNHYLTITQRMEAQFILLQKALKEWVHSGGEWATQRVAEVLSVPLTQAERLLAGKNATHIASCSDVHHGKYAPQNGDVCTQYMYCLKCPNMVVLQDDLWRLFSFRNALIRDRDSGRLPLHQWVDQFAWMVKMIDEGIVRLFKKSVVKKAQAKALQNPYPLWRDIPIQSVIETTFRKQG